MGEELRKGKLENKTAVANKKQNIYKIIFKTP